MNFQKKKVISVVISIYICLYVKYNIIRTLFTGQAILFTKKIALDIYK